MKCILIITAALFLPGCAGFLTRMHEASERQVWAQAGLYAQERAATTAQWEAYWRQNAYNSAPAARTSLEALNEQTAILREISDQQFLEWLEAP